MPKTKERKSPVPLSKKLFYAGVIVVLVIVVVTFIGLPIIGSSSSQGNLVFGTYNGKDIAYIQGGFFSQTYEYLAEIYRDTFTLNRNTGAELDFQLRFLWKTAYDQSLVQIATLDAAKESGVTVSSQLIDRTIVQSPQFNENGKFNINRYRAIPKKDLFNLQSLTADTLVYQKYYNDVVSSTKMSSQESDFIASMAGTRRSFRVMVFDEFPDAQTLSWAEDKNELFQSLALESITITETKEQAENIQQQAVHEETEFEELVKLYSKDRFANTGGSRGRTYFYELLEEFSREDVEEIFSSQEIITPVFENNSGTFVFFRRNQEIFPFNPDSEAIVEKVQSYLENREPTVIQDYLKVQAEDFVVRAQEIGFGLASEFNFVQTAAFPINYGNTDTLGTIESSLPHLSTAVQREDFFLTLFSLEDEEISEPISIYNSFWVIQADATRTLDETERESIKKDYETLAEKIKANDYSERIVDSSLLNEFFEETFNRHLRPQPAIDSPPADAAQN